MAERTLTDADIAAIAEALKPHHECRFHIPQDEFEHAWPILRGVAGSVEQAKSVTTKVVVTGLVLFVLGAIGRGVWVWLGELQTKMPLPK